MKNILILDDNKDILKALQSGLCGCLLDCKVLTAQNGEGGRDILKNTPVDLIVTDLDMPVMNGYQFIEKARTEHPDVPVCVMAGNCRPEDMERLHAMGVRKILPKPFLFDHLTDLIAKELNLKRRSADGATAGDV